MDYYEVLGVSRNSEPEVIEAAYRALMKKYHPDRSGNSADPGGRAQSINEAYAVLRDGYRRRIYDKMHPAYRPAAAAPKRPAPSQANRKPAAPVRPPASPRPRQGSRRTTARPPIGMAFSRSQLRMAGLIVGCIGLLAVAALAVPGTAPSPFTNSQTLLLPPVRASVLGGGRKQAFCVTNKTMKRVEYTLYWGGTSGRQYALRPGYYMVHISGYSAAPTIEYFGMDAGRPTRSTVRPKLSTGSDDRCDPRYSFEYKDTDISRWSQYDRFGLYPDAPAEVAPTNVVAGEKS